MSREIKYRVWDDENKSYDDPYSHSYYAMTQDGGLDFYCHGDHYDNCDPNIYTVEQYAGLKDKNGKEIYEGDIVYDIYTGDEVFIVGWDKDKASFMLADTADYPMAYFDEYELDKDLEVIGNIHENKELWSESV